MSLTKQFKCSYACLSLERSGTAQYRGMLDGFFTQIVLPAPLTSPEGKELREYQQMYINVHITVFPKRIFLMIFMFFFFFFCLPPWSKFVLGESVKHTIRYGLT